MREQQGEEDQESSTVLQRNKGKTRILGLNKEVEWKRQVKEGDKEEQLKANAI